MFCLKQMYVAAIAAAVPLGVSTVGHAQEMEPVAYVTVVTGAGATRGASGPAFPTEPGGFSDERSGLAVGERVHTLDGSAATLVFPASGIVVRLEQSSELSLNALPVVDNALEVSLTLLRGRVYVARRQSDTRWLLVAGTCDAGRGYTMSRGGAISVSVDADGVAFAAVRGDVVFFKGDAPAEAPVDQAGELTDTTGIPLPEGHHVTTRMRYEPAPAIPETLRGPVAAGALAGTLYALGLQASEEWVERAEQGDFTPVRAVSRGTPELFAPEPLGPELTFDQPRSPIVAPAPRAGVQAVQTQGVNPVRALLETRRPTSVVVGQRLARTRIIGSPGTSPGAIRVNPNAELLIRLPRR